MTDKKYLWEVLGFIHYLFSDKLSLSYSFSLCSNTNLSFQDFILVLGEKLAFHHVTFDAWHATRTRDPRPETRDMRHGTWDA